MQLTMLINGPIKINIFITKAQVHQGSAVAECNLLVAT